MILFLLFFSRKVQQVFCFFFKNRKSVWFFFFGRGTKRALGSSPIGLSLIWPAEPPSSSVFFSHLLSLSPPFAGAFRCRFRLNDFSFVRFRTAAVLVSFGVPVPRS